MKKDTKMTPGKLMYMCSNCSCVVTSEVDDVEDCLRASLAWGNSTFGLQIPEKIIHRCSDLDFGIAILIGGKIQL